MCGRYAATLPPEMMAELFGVLNSIDYPPRYNITPTQPIAVIWEQQARRTVQLVRWGYVPGWVKDPREFTLLINARAETMAEKPSFKAAVRHGRCIVPASGYYEWRVGADGTKQPYYITHADGSPLVFAGLYSQWMGPNGEEVDTACIVTVPPNTEIAQVYHRMPALLDAAEIEAWLNVRDVDVRDAVTLCHPAPDGTMAYHPVGKQVGQRDADGPELIQPISPAEAEVAPKRPRQRAAGGGDQLDLF